MPEKSSKNTKKIKSRRAPQSTLRVPDIRFRPAAFDPLDPRKRWALPPQPPLGEDPQTPLPPTFTSWPPTQNLNENPVLEITKFAASKISESIAIQHPSVSIRYRPSPYR